MNIAADDARFLSHCVRIHVAPNGKPGGVPAMMSMAFVPVALTAERLLRCGNSTSPMSARGQSPLGGASRRSSHVRNAPLATVGPKKTACH